MCFQVLTSFLVAFATGYKGNRVDVASRGNGMCKLDGIALHSILQCLSMIPFPGNPNTHATAHVLDCQYTARKNMKGLFCCNACGVGMKGSPSLTCQ